MTQWSSDFFLVLTFYICVLVYTHTCTYMDTLYMGNRPQHRRVNDGHHPESVLMLHPCDLSFQPRPQPWRQSAFWPTGGQCTFSGISYKWTLVSTHSSPAALLSNCSEVTCGDEYTNSSFHFFTTALAGCVLRAGGNLYFWILEATF